MTDLWKALEIIAFSLGVKNQWRPYKMIRYTCRYCGQQLGEFSEHNVSEKQLGLDALTQEERRDIITYMSNGDKIANVICEYCQEALEKSPELSLISNPLQ